MILEKELDEAEDCLPAIGGLAGLMVVHGQVDHV